MQRLCSVFQVPALGLGPGLRLHQHQHQDQEQEQHQEQDQHQAGGQGPGEGTEAGTAAGAGRGRALLDISDRTSCAACGCSFSSRDEQTEHYKLDWHRFNLRQRLVGAPSVSAEGFEQISGEISSISGSDSDESDPYPELDGLQGLHVQAGPSTGNGERSGDQRPQPPRSPHVLFRSADGEYLSVYRCVLQGKQAPMEEEDHLLTSLLSLSPLTVWVVLMAGGGHFAGAVFEGDAVLTHKTFHRYTVRARRGQAQAARDGQNRGQAPRSAGTSLRRHNEAALAQEVQDLLRSWASFLSSASAIFLRSPVHSRGIFFSGRSPPLTTADPRLRSVPFCTRRATFSEVQRVHATLCSIHLYAADTDLAMIGSPQRRAWVKQRPATQEPPGTSIDEGPDVALLVADLPSSLEVVEETLSTLELREFEASPRKKRGKKKKVAAGKKSAREDVSGGELGDPVPTQTGNAGNTGNAEAETGAPAAGAQSHGKKLRTIRKMPAGTAAPGQGVELRDELYTACRSGDLQRLQQLLRHPRRPAAAPPTPPPTLGRKGTGGEGADTREEPMWTPARQDQEGQTDETAVVPTLEIAARTAEETVPASENATVAALEPLVTALEPATAAALEPAVTALEPVTVAAVEPAVTALEPAVTAVVLNEPVDESGWTLLHVAAAAAQRPVLRLLLHAGSDPTLRDRGGRTPYSVCADRDTRNEFRRFMARHPARFNYPLSQIPAPLSSEAETMRADRRRAQKTARRAREKERAEERRKEEEEEEERKRYSTLSEREKRAVAAERRLAQQLVSDGASRTDRCWLCGRSLQGRVPFHYLDYSFCTTRCLQDHRHRHPP